MALTLLERGLPARVLDVGTSGVDVADTHDRLAALGFAVPADDQRTSTYGNGTRDAVASFQRAHGLAPNGVLDAATASALSAAVAEAAYIVTGTVSSPSSASVGGLDVQVVDKNVGGDVPVAATTADARGAYTATAIIARDALLKRRKTRPDLQARVSLGTAFLAASDVVYDAPSTVVLDVELPPDAALPSEYDTLTAAVAASYAGSLGALQENDKRQDITYLANKTGWDARAVALLALAAQFAQTSAPTPSSGAAGTPAIRPELYYALFRAGLPANPDTLYQASTATVEGIWKQALAQAVIAPSLAPEIPKALSAYRTLSAKASLSAKPAIGISPLKDLLQLSLPDAAQQQQFAELYAEHAQDAATLWTAVQDKLGADVSKRLRLDGQLGYMTLNNAPLMTALHAAEQRTPLTAALDLATRGYYDAAKWQPLIGASIPAQVPGDTIDDQRANYAELLAAQVRIAFPTAVIADLVRQAKLPIAGGPDVATAVAGFLTSNQGRFEIGIEPIDAYIARNHIAATPAAVVAQVKRLQRVYQLTPDDKSMTALLQANLDSAFAITRYDAAGFARSFAAAVGGTQAANDIHARAKQIYGNVLNLVTHYVTSQRAPVLGGASYAPVLDARSSPRTDPAYPVVAYPTLQTLFGSMDYCECDECRSILGPAAYLVDLLHFVDCAAPQAGFHNPQEILFGRRPDLQHLQLTCANTNTALPYIDIVNETLEFFVAHDHSLNGFAGFNTGDAVTSAELLATPQNVDDAAYTVVENVFFPVPLPFNRPLALLRLHLDAIGVPLHRAMIALRASDAVDRGAQRYGWRDILMERLGLSREEYRVLTDSTIGLRGVYGYPALSESDVLTKLQNASLQDFSRRLHVTYDDLFAIVETRFVNPGSALIPLLQQLHMPFSTLQKLKDGSLSDADFEALLPPGIDARAYGAPMANDPAAVAAWVRDNYASIMAILAYVNPADPSDVCASAGLVLRHVNPQGDNLPHGADFLKLVRFIRLWRKLGLRIGQVDDILAALYPGGELPTGTDDAADYQRLDAGFVALLPRIGFLYEAMDLLGTGLDALPSLLACWAPIDTTGDDSLYASMFLSPALLLQDPAFATDGAGRVLQDASQKLLAHATTLCAAFHLTGAEFDLINAALGFDASTVLDAGNISAVYRTGWLARALRLSVVEFIALKRQSGLDPFAALDPSSAAPAEPATLRFLRLVQAMNRAGLRPVQALYLLWNVDLNGKATPPDRAVTGLATMLRAAYAAVESQFTLVDDPDGTIAKGLMTLVYGSDASDFFFGLLDDTFVTTTAYSNASGTIAQPIVDAAAGRLTYDDLHKVIAFAGVLDATTQSALDAAISANGNDATLHAALASLAASNHRVVDPFFARYPELSPLYGAYAASSDPPQAKRRSLLASFLPGLKQKRKQEQALASVSSVAATDPEFASALLRDARILHASTNAGVAADVDLTALETPGLAAAFHLTDDAATPADTNVDAVERIDYGSTGLALPAGQGGGAITAIWRGYLDAPQDGFYDIAIDADAGADVALNVRGATLALAASGNRWTNQDPLSLTAGQLVAVELRVAHVRTRVTLSWRSQGLGWQAVPGIALYSATLVDNLRATYLRFLKATSLAAALSLAPPEIAWLGTNAGIGVSAFPINGEGWLNHLPVRGNADATTAAALRAVLEALLDFASMKAAVSPADERLLSIVQTPDAVNEDASLALTTTTGWSLASIQALLQQFFGDTNLGHLSDIGHLRRVYDAYAVVASCRVPAATLVAATTNAPDPADVAALQSALRALYANDDWRTVVQPINDRMRQMQRDALVACILQQLGDLPPSTPPLPDDLCNVDTADKLYEYLLIDPQTEPAVRTSRIRLALSAVQIFIERCLRNLEPRVSPSDIDAGEWTWMKRYRVWQANREIYLWPENWLYPELRDDQSPFFKQMTSALLQSDITDDAAESAYLDYLTSLESVAKLEPCGLYYIPGDAGQGNAAAYVVARTAGAHRKYYFRQFSNAGWTPWTEMKIDPDDLPVTPILWKGRLLVFWLKVMKQTPVSPSSLPSSSGTGTITSMTIGQIQDAANANVGARTQVTMSATLCWSEFYNDKWQPAKTSDLNRPTFVGAYAADDHSFEANRMLLRLEPTELGGDMAGALLLSIASPLGNTRGGFVLYNTHSLPIRVEEVQLPLSLVSLFAARRSFSPVFPYTGGSMALAPVPYIWNNTDYSTFTIDYSSGLWLNKLPHQSNKVLKPALIPRYVSPQGSVPDVWDAPFFYEDRRNVFYVTTSQAMVTIPQFGGFGLGTGLTNALGNAPTIPPVVLPPKPKPPRPGVPVTFGSSANGGDAYAIRQFVATDATIHAAFGSTMTVTYQGQEIGAKGIVAVESTAGGSARP